MTELKYNDITQKIIGCAFEVYSFLDNACLPVRQGFQKVIYQRALAWEFGQAGLEYAREISQEIYYKELTGTRPADFVVEEKALRTSHSTTNYQITNRF